MATTLAECHLQRLPSNRLSQPRHRDIAVDSGWAGGKARGFYFCAVPATSRPKLTGSIAPFQNPVGTGQKTGILASNNCRLLAGS